MKIGVAKLTILLWTSCSIDWDYHPERVKGIPNDAFWVGGADGGQWYLVENIDKKSGTANFKIYNDYSGAKEISKKFKLECNSEDVISWDNLEQQISAFDGQRIILNVLNKDGKDGKYCSFQ